MDYSDMTREQLMRLLMARESNREDTNPATVYVERLKDRFDPMQEEFYVLTLDNLSRVKGVHLVSKGTVNRTLVHPRDVFRPALLDNAVAVILAHNHPSGDMSPSEDDERLTKRMAQAGRAVGIKVLDHIVFDDSAFLSMLETEPSVFGF